MLQRDLWVLFEVIWLFMYCFKEFFINVLCSWKYFLSRLKCYCVSQVILKIWIYMLDLAFRKSKNECVSELIATAELGSHHLGGCNMTHICWQILHFIAELFSMSGAFFSQINIWTWGDPRFWNSILYLKSVISHSGLIFLLSRICFMTRSDL